MKITVSGKNMVVTDALRNTVERKMNKLEKYFNTDLELKATVNVEKNRHIFEVTIPFNGTILRSEEVTDDMYTSIDRAVDILERQIRKHKTKLERRYHSGGSIKFENIAQLPLEDEEARIVKTKKFAMKPMGEEEAVLQMELIAHSFFVFRNAETNEVNVVYKRKDGNYGLIEPEF